MGSPRQSKTRKSRIPSHPIPVRSGVLRAPDCITGAMAGNRVPKLRKYPRHRREVTVRHGRATRTRTPAPVACAPCPGRAHEDTRGAGRPIQLSWSRGYRVAGLSPRVVPTLARAHRDELISSQRSRRRQQFVVGVASCFEARHPAPAAGGATRRWQQVVACQRLCMSSWDRGNVRVVSLDPA
jgi:hypothetical protein